MVFAYLRQLLCALVQAIQSNEDIRAFLDIHIHFSPALASNDLRASIVKVGP